MYINHVVLLLVMIPRVLDVSAGGAKSPSCLPECGLAWAIPGFLRVGSRHAENQERPKGNKQSEEPEVEAEPGPQPGPQPEAEPQASSQARNNVSPGAPWLASKIKDGSVQKIVVMVGAGISTSSGIPDFRSPGGLYETVKKKHPDLKDPQDIFDINYFNRDPVPFNLQAKEMLPGKFQPTATHFFLRLLKEKGLLTRVYTQNIDTMERLAGLGDEDVVYAHGNFKKVGCVKCGKQMRLQKWREEVEAERVPTCGGSPWCSGFVKPDIVFFGEPLGLDRGRISRDFAESDALLVFGTSLNVAPFNGLITTPLRRRDGGGNIRVLVNRDKVGTAENFGWGGFRFNEGGVKTGANDLFIQGDRY